MKCHNNSSKQKKIFPLITLIISLIIIKNVNSWSLHRVRPVIIRRQPPILNSNMIEMMDASASNPHAHYMSAEASNSYEGNSYEGYPMPEQQMMMSKYQDEEYKKPEPEMYHQQKEEYKPEMESYKPEQEQEEYYPPQKMKMPKRYPMMMPMAMPMRHASPANEAMITSASNMEMPMMMPMPLTTAMHNQMKKGQEMMQQLMDQLMKMNPLGQMRSPMMSSQSMSSPCGMSMSQPMMGGGGGGGKGSNFDLMGMLQQLSPLNFMNSLQQMFANMRKSGMGMFGMMNSQPMMSGGGGGGCGMMGDR